MEFVIDLHCEVDVKEATISSQVLATTYWSTTDAAIQLVELRLCRDRIHYRLKVKIKLFQSLEFRKVKMSLEGS
jgi:hypothetical protein